MTETVEGGASLAWRLLATLEGGSLLLATSALLAYTARARVTRRKRHRNVKRVLITDISNPLGRELKTKLEACSCTVTTVTSDATSGAASGAGSGADEIDALVVVGSEPREHTLNDVAQLVSEDVYHNLRLLEFLSPRLRAGGCVAWASAGATSGAYSAAIAAFDSVLRASLMHVAKVSHCEAIWIGRGESAARAADRTVAELTTNNELQHTHGFSIRNAAHKVSEYLGRWLKIIT